MSYSKSQNQVTKSFCKVCLDAGKPESVYTSHFVKSSKEDNARIVCPTLLAQECRYCKKNGHTVKYCKVLEKDNKQKDRQMKMQKIQKEKDSLKKEAKPIKKRNAFMALCEDSDSEEEKIVKVEKVEITNNTKLDAEFPQLVPHFLAKQDTISFASIISKAYKDQEQEQAIQREQAIQKEQEQEKEKQELEQKLIIQSKERKVLSSIPLVKQPKKYTSWADSDSEDEDDEKYEVVAY